MKLENATKLVAGVSLAALLLTGIAPTTASAQRRRGAHRPARVIVYRTYYPYWYNRYDPFWDFHYSPYVTVVDPIANQRERGYREGRGEGKDDAKKFREWNARGHKDYLKSNSLTFREAFVRGYADGYREKRLEMQREARKRRD